MGVQSYLNYKGRLVDVQTYAKLIEKEGWAPKQDENKTIDDFRKKFEQKQVVVEEVKELTPEQEEKIEVEKEIDEVKEEEQDEKEELLEKAKELGINAMPNWKVETIKKKIEEKQSK